MQPFTNNNQQPISKQNNSSSHRPLWQMIVELGEEIPEEEWEKVSSDASMNYKKYLYGVYNVI
ncbi:MAG: hypothetical protein QNJ37_16300 [Crocosphaera sp.]|nr:hypothetical protein [Crocosphaera sp.]